MFTSIQDPRWIIVKWFHHTSGLFWNYWWPSPSRWTEPVASGLFLFRQWLIQYTSSYDNMMHCDPKRTLHPGTLAVRFHFDYICRPVCGTDHLEIIQCTPCEITQQNILLHKLISAILDWKYFAWPKNPRWITEKWPHRADWSRRDQFERHSLKPTSYTRILSLLIIYIYIITIGVNFDTNLSTSCSEIVSLQQISMVIFLNFRRIRNTGMIQTY